MSVFKGLAINLAGPICACQEQDLGWSVIGSIVEPGLRIYCRFCKTELRVPNSQLMAFMLLEAAYPGVDVPEVTVKPRHLGIMSGGKLLDFKVNTGESDQ